MPPLLKPFESDHCRAPITHPTVQNPNVAQVIGEKIHPPSPEKTTAGP